RLQLMSAPSPLARRFRNTFSATVRVGTTIDRWYTQATRASQAPRSGRLGVGSPASRTAPRSGRLNPVRRETSVDFPAPFRPTSPCDSPARTLSDTSTSARVSPNDLETCSASPTGAGMDPGPVDEGRCIGWLTASRLLVVAPQVGAVDLGRVVVTGKRHQR